ncbi:unnamed protein product, partial [Dibothriocephalus latus]
RGDDLGSQVISECFTVDPKEFNRHPAITVNGTSLLLSCKPKFLGVCFDTLFTFADNVRKVASKVSRCTKVLKAHASTSWCCAKETFAIMFKALTKTHLTYAASVWSPTIARPSVRRLQSAQKAALRLITGCYKMPPIYHLHAEASFLPVAPHNALLSQQFWWTCSQPDLPVDGFASMINLQRLYQRADVDAVVTLLVLLIKSNFEPRNP